MSARRVLAMAAIIGDAHGCRQPINDTRTHDQRIGHLDWAASNRRNIVQAG